MKRTFLLFLTESSVVRLDSSEWKEFCNITSTSRSFFQRGVQGSLNVLAAHTFGRCAQSWYIRPWRDELSDPVAVEIREPQAERNPAQRYFGFTASSRFHAGAKSAAPACSLRQRRRRRRWLRANVRLWIGNGAQLVAHFYMHKIHLPHMDFLTFYSFFFLFFPFFLAEGDVLINHLDVDEMDLALYA